jgi:hypothetical protein
VTHLRERGAPEASQSAIDIGRRMERITADVGRRMDRMFVVPAEPRADRGSTRRARPRGADARRNRLARRTGRIPPDDAAGSGSRAPGPSSVSAAPPWAGRQQAAARSAPLPPGYPGGGAEARRSMAGGPPTPATPPEVIVSTSSRRSRMPRRPRAPRWRPRCPS